MADDDDWEKQGDALASLALPQAQPQRVQPQQAPIQGGVEVKAAPESDDWEKQGDELVKRTPPREDALPPPADHDENYNTILKPDEENKFRKWAAEKGVAGSGPNGLFDPDNPREDYNLRGYWKDKGGKLETTQNENDRKPHFTDEYKKPWHPSFSAESNYADKATAPRWINDYQLADRNGKILYDEKLEAAKRKAQEANANLIKGQVAKSNPMVDTLLKGGQDVLGKVPDVIRGMGLSVAQAIDLVGTPSRAVNNILPHPPGAKPQQTLTELYNQYIPPAKDPIVEAGGTGILPALITPEITAGGILAHSAMGAGSGALMDLAEQAGENKGYDPRKTLAAALGGFGATALLHGGVTGVKNTNKAIKLAKIKGVKNDPDRVAQLRQDQQTTKNANYKQEAEERDAAQRAEQVRQTKLGEQSDYEKWKSEKVEREAEEQHLRDFQQLIYDENVKLNAKFNANRDARIANEREKDIKKVYYLGTSKNVEAETKATPSPEPLPETPPPPAPTVREDAVKMRDISNAPKTDAKHLKSLNTHFQELAEATLAKDQAKLNWQTSHEALENATGKLGRSPKPNQVVDAADEIRRTAALLSGLDPDTQLVARNVKTTSNVIRETPLRPYEVRGKTPEELAIETKFWRQRYTHKPNEKIGDPGGLKEQYEAIRKASGIEKYLSPGEAIQVQRGPHKFRVEYRETPDEYEPTGTPEQNADYIETRNKLTEEVKEYKQAMNGEVEPSISRLADELEADRPDIATVLRQRKPITADNAIVAEAKKQGIDKDWVSFLKDLAEHDSQVSRMFGIGLVAAGQAIGQKAEARSREEEQSQNLTDLGAALTFTGGLVIAGPKIIKALPKDFVSLVEHYAWYIPDHIFFPALKAGLNAMKNIKVAGAKGLLDVKRIIHIATVNRASWDVIRREADPVFVGRLESQMNKWMKAVGGKGLVPEPHEPVEVQQAWVRGLRSSERDIDKLQLSQKRRDALKELARVKKEGAKLIKAEIEKLDPTGKGAKFGDGGLANMLRAELKINWESDGLYSRHILENILNAVAHGVSDIVQMGNLPLHWMHVKEGAEAVGSRLPTEMAEASAILASGNKAAHGLCDSINVKMPLFGHAEDTANPITDAIDRFLQKVSNVTGLSALGKTKPVRAAGEVLSGRAMEKHLKINHAITAATIKAADDLKYPGGFNQLATDLTHWLNGETYKCSGAFTEANGLRALSTIRDTLDQGIGAGPSGFRVSLPVDRAALHSSLVKIFFPFVRTATIANRSKTLLITDTLRHIENGEFDKARSSFRSFVYLYAIGATVLGGAAIDREVEEYLLETDPPTAQTLHDAMHRFNVIGNAPGAVGGALQAAGVKNDLSKYNFEMTHTRPAVAWWTRINAPIIVSDAKLLTKTAIGKASDKEKERLLTTMVGQVGLSKISNTVSLENMRKISQAYRDSANQGGTINYTYPKEAPFGLNELLPRGSNVFGYEHPHYVSSHLEDRDNPILAAIEKAIRPGETVDDAENRFHDMVEYKCEEKLKVSFGQDARDALAEQLEQNRPEKKRFDSDRRKLSQGKDIGEEEKAAYDNIKERYATLEKENDTEFDTDKGRVTPRNYWLTMLRQAEADPEWAKKLEPSPRYAKRHHRKEENNGQVISDEENPSGK